MGFPTSVADEVLVRCGRHCCICEEFVGSKIELHHIVQVADGGDNSVDNCIPLCFNCHAEVKSYNPKHPKGRMYTPTELKGHRDKCYKKYGFADNMTKMDVAETEKPIFASNKSDVAVTWGYVEQDKLCPLLPGALVLIAGYTESRKSTYVQHIANWNIKQGHRVAYCCLRNHPTQIAFEIIAEAAHINANDMKTGMMTEENWKSVEQANKDSHSENLALIPYDKVSKSDDIIELVENSGADIVVVDDFNGLVFDNHNSVEKFLYELKNVAGRTNTTVFCIYNLDVPKVRVDKRPMLSDFPSDCYHRMFDVIQFLFMPEKHYADAYEEKDMLEVINVKGAWRNPLTFRMVSPENITGVFSIETNK
ncbi:MAG: HNH endonuclease [Lachnospiraceae bacterium]|nr:HNH endonuclease [Lachnospiraceae bacterium]